MLNRSALIVRPAEPFIKWAASLDDSGIVPNAQDEKTVYLLPEWGDDKEAERILKMVYAEVFERELDGWWTDESDWPQRRTYKMFKQWFKIEMHSMVEDLCDFALHDDDFD